MYLITYDISEKRRKYRNVLRKYLKRIGAGKLQASVWITPYNSKDILREFVKEYRLQGSIIVSDLGSDGAIGDEDLMNLIIRVYQLKQLNERYENWLAQVEEDEMIDSLTVVRYLSILRDDPQLPFALYPDWWVGDRAYRAVRKRLME